jgi:hypothetical protein
MPGLPQLKPIDSFRLYPASLVLQTGSKDTLTARTMLFQMKNGQVPSWRAQGVRRIAVTQLELFKQKSETRGAIRVFWFRGDAGTAVSAMGLICLVATGHEP